MNGTWIGTALTLLGGGAMGALIKIFYDLNRERRQPISINQSIFSLFRHDKRFNDLEAVLSVAHNGSISEFRTLFVGDVMLRNSSNRDHPDFDFGISLGADSKCVHVGWENPDQHHILSLIDAVSPSEPRAEMRFNLRPFNRNDMYSLRVYLVPGPNDGDPTIKQFTSPQAVRFVDSPGPADRTQIVTWMTVVLSLIAVVIACASSYLSYRQWAQGYDIGQKMRLIQLHEDCVSRNGSGKPKFKLNLRTLECVEINGPGDERAR
jgi:hypothetical protein